MITLRGHLEICRFDHWIKNVFVLPGTLVALAFTARTVDAGLIEQLVIGLVATGLVTSSNYVINEILDAPFDRKHPRKHARPAAAGRVNIPLAYVQWIVLMLAGFALGTLISRDFMLVLAALWAMGCVYNIPPLRTKDVPYLDVLSESVNNPLRMLAGWYIVGPAAFPSASLLLSYWMLGGYLMAMKRYAEFRDITGHRAAAADYRKSFRYYTEERLLVSTMFYAAASMLFLGAFIMRYKIELIFSFPFVAWVMALYMHLAFEKESAVQAPEKLYREPWLMISVALCSAAMIGLFFVHWPSVIAFFAPTMPVLN